MYDLSFHKEFEKKYRKYTKKNRLLKKQVDTTLVQLQEDPYFPGLKTHKVNTKNFGMALSSRVSGDIRII
jgi:mRNA-degrading endonuclease YafQ of YafQ-DinJ toxin-antitoxin module